MPRRQNPYIAGPPVSGRNFYGRENIFRFVQDTFSSPHQNVVVLYGQRRIGKTSILHELPSRLSPEFHTVFFDLQDKAQHRLNEVLYDLAREIAGSLNLDAPPGDDFLRDGDYFHKRFLPRIYQNLGPKRLLLMFDEFDVLDMPEEELARDVAVRAFFPYFRRRLMYEKQVVFMFVVGRRLDELDRLRKSIFKMAKTAHVSFLEEAEARQLVVESALGVLEYGEEAVGRITSITAGHPYLTQIVCSELFNCMETERTHVKADDVEAVVDRAIAAGETGLAWIWDGLPPAERPVLSVVAHAAKGGHAATPDDINRTLKDLRAQFSGLELTRAPDNLTKRELLRRTADGYEFVVDFLQRWILRTHPLEQVWLDLESASPRAIKFYKLAVKFHKDGKLDDAIRLYERAVGTNPNHVLAQLGLAQARFEQGKIEEAIIEYEQAYRLNELMARDGLIKARQKWAEALEKAGRVDEADQEYRTILDIAPRDHRLREEVANRWITRGRKYLAEGRYEEAVAEYEKATTLNVLVAHREALIAARQTWAEILEREGKADEADQQYEAIRRLALGDDRLKECVANCLVARGQKCLEAGGYEKAVVEYEKADAFGLSSAREGLMAARQAWAKALEREYKAGEADRQYDAILGIAPDDAGIREWVANSLIERGDRYLEEGPYGEASKAYDRAERIQPEKQQALAQRRRRLELAPDYDEAMKAHKDGEWGAAWERWAELYRKDPDYKGRDSKGKRVAELLKEALDEREKVTLQMVKREKVAERRRKLLLFLGGLAMVLIAVFAVGLWVGPWPGRSSETPTPVASGEVVLIPTASPTTATTTPMASPTATATPTAASTAGAGPAAAPPVSTATPTASPTATATSTATPSPTATATPTLTPTPSPTATATLVPTPPWGTRSILDVDINPDNNKMIYVVVKGEGIYKTTDNGHHWKLIIDLPNIETLTLGRVNPQTVFAAADRVMWKSTDGGASWPKLPTEIRDKHTDQPLKGAVHVLAVAPGNDRIIYAGTDGGVYRSDDGSVNWELRDGGMGGIPIYALVVASGDGQLVYAAGEGAETWQTFDGGNFWNKLPFPGEVGAIYTLELV